MSYFLTKIIFFRWRSDMLPTIAYNRSSVHSSNLFSDWMVTANLFEEGVLYSSTTSSLDESMTKMVFSHAKSDPFTTECYAHPPTANYSALREPALSFTPSKVNLSLSIASPAFWSPDNPHVKIRFIILSFGHYLVLYINRFTPLLLF